MEALCIVILTISFSIVSANENASSPVETYDHCAFSNYSLFPDVVNRTGFVDKTMLIKRVFEGGTRMLITAPRKFGKSTNLHMLKTFLAVSANLESWVRTRRMFETLNIYREEREFFDTHYAKYPLIYMDFKSCIVRNYTDAIRELRHKVRESYLEHSYLRNSGRLSEDERKAYDMWRSFHDNRQIPEGNVRDGLALLVGLLRRHFNRTVVVLVDQYDVLATKALYRIQTREELASILELLTYVFGSVVRGNGDVERVVITGISYLSTTGLAGLGNDIVRYKFLEDHPLVEYYGFTRAETDRLFQDHGYDLQWPIVREAYYTYDGYVSRNGTNIYSAISILKFLEYHRVDSYWNKSGRIQGLNYVLRYPIMEARLFSLLKGAVLSVTIRDPVTIDDVFSLSETLRNETAEGKQPDPDLVLSYFLELGYLTYTSGPLGSRGGTFVRLPNKETEEKLFRYFNIYCVYKTPKPTLDQVRVHHLPLPPLPPLRSRY